MATTNASINIAVNGLEKLDRLQSSVDNVTKKFGGLRGAIATLGVAALGRSALAMADDLQDLSNATGIATARLLEFKKALTVAGGQADSMATGISQFVRTIDEAAQGSIKAQNSFMELGISLNDLRSLSEQELLQKALQGIAAIEDPARRAGAMMEYFGKSFKTVDPRELSQRLQDSAGSADKYAQTIARAAELNDQLATAQATLKLAFLETFGPVLSRITDFNKAIEEGRASVDTLVTIFKTLTVVVATAFAFTAVGAAVRIIGTIGRGFAALIPKSVEFGKVVSGVFRANGPVMSALRGVVGAIAAIGAGIATVLGLSKETPNAGAGRGGQGGPTAEELAAYNKEQLDAQNEANQKREVETRQRDNAIKQVRDITAEYQKQGDLNLKRLNLETELIGKSDDEKTRRQALFDLEQRFLDIQDNLIKKRDTLSKEEQFLVPIYNEQLKASQQLYETQRKGLEEVLGKQQLALALERDRQQTIEQINKSLERQATFGDQLVAANDKLKSIEFEGKIEGLNDVQKQIARINEEARQGALQAGRAIAATYEGLDLSAAQSAELAKRLEDVQAVYKKIADSQVANLQQSRTWASGIKRAFNEYIDSARNASETAKNLFSKAMSGMEDLIVNFAKTGKFEWKSFVASMAEELLRSQIRQAFSSILEGISNQAGQGGILGTIGSMLGLGGAGGVAPGSSPQNPSYVSVVNGGFGGGGFGAQPGAGGGSIFDSIGNVFSGITRSVGSAVNSIGSAVGNIFSGVTNSIGSIFNNNPLISGGGIGGGGSFFGDIASGISDLFGGFFANGGTLGAGKFGIVGERGPELISGPASITPMAATSVTYNINAVDAQSFKQMIAADPSFIHAVAMQGGKSMPRRY